MQLKVFNLKCATGDILLMFFIFIEIIYLTINFNNLKCPCFRVKSMFGKFYLYKAYILIVILSLITLVPILFSMAFKTNLALSFLFIGISLLIYIEYKLVSNSNISTNIIDIKNNIHQFNTGDIILFETPQNIETAFSIIPVLFININHIGIIIKDVNNKLFILESEHTEHICKYSNRNKTGVMLLDLEERIKPFDNVYLVKTSLHKHIKHNELVNVIEKYKDKEYMEDNINCVTFTSLFFKDLNLIHNNTDDNAIYLDYKYFLNKDNYKDDFNFDIYKIK